MPRILLRAAKAPWVPVRAEDVLAENVQATNAGNLLFGQSMFRALSVEGTEVVANNYSTSKAGVDKRYIDRMNAEFDHFVIPLANAFRPSYRDNLKRLTSVIDRLRIPVTVVGVGSQHKLRGESVGDDDLDRDVKRFVSAVLDRSASIGVRGARTAEYLDGLGFGSDVIDIIGCPSLYMNGADVAVEPKVDALDENSRIAMSVSPYVTRMAEVVEHHAKKYLGLIYIPQNSVDLKMMLWGDPLPKIRDRRIPSDVDHPLYTGDQMRFPLDPQTWVDYLRGFDFAFGTRIHGTISALLAGTPALLLAHDSRTIELAEYHKIPHLPINKLPKNADAAKLYSTVDFDEFNAHVPATLARFTQFLEKNDLDHALSDGSRAAAYDEKMANAQLPPMVHPVLAASEAGRREVMSRLQWLRQGDKGDALRKEFAIEQALPRKGASAATLGSRLASLEKKVDEISRRRIGEIESTAAELSTKVSRMESKLAGTTAGGASLLRRVRRRVRSALRALKASARSALGRLRG